MLISLFFLVFFLLLSTFFSAAETAFTTLTSLQIEILQKKYGLRGKHIKKLSEKSEVLLVTILIGNNLANVAASTLVSSMVISSYGHYWLGLSSGLLTLFILIFAEVTPKRLALVANQKVCLFSVWPLYGCVFIFRPFAWLILKISSLITGFLRSKTDGDLSKENLLHIFSLARKMGIVKENESQMLKGVFRFKDVTAGAIMTHRRHVFELHENISVRQALKEIRQSNFSRLLCYGDNQENITGVVLAEDVYKAALELKQETKLKELSYKPLFVPEIWSLSRLLGLFKKEVLNLAVVLDEYGGLAGVVTLEDVAEEILGELHDEREYARDEQIVKQENETFLIQGDTSLQKVEDDLDIELEPGYVSTTLSGFIAEKLGRIPQLGDNIGLENIEIKVRETDSNRVVWAVCKKLYPIT